VVSPIFTVGKSAKQIEMSIAVMMNSTLLTNFSTSKPPSVPRNFIRLSEARLQDESSSERYSEQLRTTTPLAMYEWLRGSERLYVVSMPSNSRLTSWAV
jgi:hypothetical protein